MSADQTWPVVEPVGLPGRLGALVRPEGVPLVLVHGAADTVSDSFLGTDLRRQRIAAMLWRRLRTLGYQRVLLNRRRHPVFGFDLLSARPLTREPQAGGADTPRRSGPITGPAGRPLVLPQSSQGRRSLDDLGAIEVLSAAIQNRANRTAVVFLEAEEWLLHNTARDWFATTLNRWLERPRAPGNVCLLVFRQRTLEEVLAFVERCQSYPTLVALIRAFEEPPDRHAVTPGRLVIGPPGLDELERLIHWHRLVHGLQVDWTASEAIVRAMVASRATLNTWFDHLDTLVEQHAPLDVNQLRARGWTPEASPDGRSAMSRLEAMIGLTAVKEHVVRIREFTSWQQSLVTRGINSDANRLNLVFTGNPGTGKTSVARLIGEIYRDIGALPIGHVFETRPSDLVGAYQGHTQRAVESAVEQARGGILFIDEAYALSDSAGGSGSGRASFERQALTTLVQLMERERGNLAVLVAGYPDKMEEFLRADPGLARRFPEQNRIHFPNYNPPELYALLRGTLDRWELRLADGMPERLTELIERLSDSRGFGNAGTMENLAQSIAMRWSARVRGERTAPVTLDDLRPEDRALLSDAETPPVEEILDRLNHLVGLAPVKRMLSDLAVRLEGNRRRQAQGLRGDPVTAPHLLFIGPPGTGKTTVARLVGELFHALSLLPRGHIEPASRGDLVAEWTGQTAPRTKEAVERASGGVLFIDEAYSLTSGNPWDQFGQEAVSTLVEEMENRRGQFVIIAAGYPAEMRQFLAANAGLRSRFGATIEFPAYSVSDLGKILRLEAERQDYRLSAEVQDRAEQWLAAVARRERAGFGNARTVRERLLPGMTRALAARTKGDEAADLRTFHVEDVPNEL